MRNVLLAAAGGAIGAAARHLVNVSMLAWLGPSFPWATFTVNVLGSLMMGVVVESILLFAEGSTTLRTFIATGILGGFTTFSAFSLDLYVLYERRQLLEAAVYLVGSILLAVTALVVGMALVRGFAK